MKLKIIYDDGKGNSGEMNAEVSQSIGDDILLAAQGNRRHIVKSYWSRLLRFHKGHSAYNPYIVNNLRYGRFNNRRTL
jgi:hypothetical protein